MMVSGSLQPHAPTAGGPHSNSEGEEDSMYENKTVC